MASRTRRAFAASLIFANIVFANLSSGIGAVGQGRSLFTPTCGFACLNTFWSLKLHCSESNVNATFSINTPACHASSNTYLESLAWCLRQRCPGEGLTNAQVENFWLEFAGDGLQVSAWSSYLISEPKETLRYGATTLNTPSLANSSMYDASRHSILSYAEQEKYHALWSTIIIVVSVGIALLVGLRNWLDGFVLQLLHRTLSTPPLIKKHLLDPAFIGKRNLQILPWKLGYAPQRSTTLLIIIFVGINVALNFVNTPSFNNDSWFISSSTLSISNLANRLGVLAVANLALAIMLSGRNSTLLYLTGCSRTTIIAFHRWAGRVAVIKAIAHGAIYLSTSDKYGVKVYTRSGALHYIGCNASYWELGIATLAIFGATLFLSLAPIRVYWYEAFLLSHVVLGISGLVTLWYHLSYRFHSQYGYEVWLYIAFAFWVFDRVARVLRLGALNYGSSTSRTPSAKIELLSNGQLMKVTAYATSIRSSKPGRYCFVYFPTLTWFFESHPFSIIAWGRGNGTGEIEFPRAQSRRSSTQDAEIGVALRSFSDDMNTTQVITERAPLAVDAHPNLPTITFIIRPCSGITRRLHQRLARSSAPISLPVLIEGPYGSSAKEVFTSETVLAFAGGIGITGILGYLDHYVTISKTAATPKATKAASFPRRFVLLWMVASAAEIEALMPFFPTETVMRDIGVELHVICKEKGANRVDFGAEIVKEKRGLSRKKSVCVLVCGPPQMADEIRSQVVSAEATEGGRLELCVEAFAW